jgi:hypothetical protein
MSAIDGLRIREDSGGVTIAVKVVPGASRDRVAGVLGEALKVTTSAAAEKGKANAAAARVLAKALGVDRRAVALAGGPRSPRKEFRVEGLTADQVRKSLHRTEGES